MHPFIIRPLAARVLCITKPTTGKAIEVLFRAGILAKVGARKREQLCRYDAYRQLMD